MSGSIRYSPVFTPFPSTSGSLCTGGPSGVIDSLNTLRPAEDLYKSFSVCSENREDIFRRIGDQIFDNEHPLSDLGDTEIRAVKHHPFHAVPQVIKRGEDGRKTLQALVMRKQSWNVLKQKIRRSSGFSRAQSEESASACSNPFLRPAFENAWQGNPPHRRSKPGRSFGSIFLASG